MHRPAADVQSRTTKSQFTNCINRKSDTNYVIYIKCVGRGGGWPKRCPSHTISSPLWWPGRQQHKMPLIHVNSKVTTTLLQGWVTRWNYFTTLVLSTIFLSFGVKTLQKKVNKVISSKAESDLVKCALRCHMLCSVFMLWGFFCFVFLFLLQFNVSFQPSADSLACVAPIVKCWFTELIHLPHTRIYPLSAYVTCVTSTPPDTQISLYHQ